MVEVTFVSSNPGKFREVRDVLAGYGVRVRWLRRELPELQAPTLETVARYKLAAVGRRRGLTLVEDSGLFLAALGGFPGVYSAHFLKIWGFPPIFRLLRGRDRAASFRAVAALKDGTTVRLFVGEVRGAIARSARGSHGFGYDPIFVPAGHRRTFAELGLETKNALSHRAQAMRGVGRYLARRSGKRVRKGLVAGGRRSR